MKISDTYQVYCLLNRDLPMVSDLEAYFGADGHYLILIDDFNRFQQRKLILDLIRRQKNNYHVKLILTVRDYALNEVREIAEEFIEPAKIRLSTLNSDQIRTLMREELGITNSHYLERIANVARGNPRIAVMAARVAKEHHTLASIADVTAVYDAYFSSILKDIKGLEQKGLLPIAGAVSLFRYIDRTNQEFVMELATQLEMTDQEFWNRVERLHDLEILDLYDHEMAKFSDQILATYLFYRAFFVEDFAKFNALFRRFFYLYQRRFRDAIYAIIDAFDALVIIDKLRGLLEPIWQQVEQDEISALTMMQVFWFVDPTRVLLYLREQIEAMPAAHPESLPRSYTMADRLDELSPIGILSLFANASHEHFKTALDLVFAYLDKQPDKIPEILLCLIDRFGIDNLSAAHGYCVQSDVINGLISRIQHNPQEVYPRLFLVVARKYLSTSFRQHRFEDRNIVRIAEFKLHLTAELENLRSSIWQQVFALIRVPDYEDIALHTLLDYAFHWPDISVPEIVEYDAKQILPFITQHLRPERFLDCWVVQHFLDLLERRKVGFDSHLREIFTNDTLELANLLLRDRDKIQELGWEEYEQARLVQFQNYLASYTLDDYVQMFRKCVEIGKVLGSEQDQFELRQSVEQALVILNRTNPELYVQVVEEYLEDEDALRLHPTDVVSRLIAVAGVATTYSIIETSKETIRHRWLFAFHIALPQNQITPKHVEELYDLYRNASWDAIPQMASYLVKYAAIDRKAIANVTRILIGKADDFRAAHTLEDLFNQFPPTFDRLQESFADDIALLKATYFLVCSQVNYADHDGQVFNLLLDFDQDFITEYIEWRWQWRNGILTALDDHRDYTFIWHRADYKSVLMKAVACLFRLEQADPSFLDGYMQVFFGTKAPEEHPYKGVEPQMVGFLCHLINEFPEDIHLMTIVFDVAVHVLPHQYARLLTEFLNVNQQFDAFARLPYEPSSTMSWGSFIPVYQERIRFLESLLPLLNTVQLLKHRKHIEERTRHYRQRIEDEQRRQFIEPD